MEYMEESTLGMDTFKSLREKYELPLPIIDFDGSNVVVTFPRTIDVVREVSATSGIEDLNDEEVKGYEWIKLEGEVSTRGYATHFDYGYKKAQRHLNKMISLGLVEDNGKPKTSRDYKYVAIDIDWHGHHHRRYVHDDANNNANSDAHRHSHRHSVHENSKGDNDIDTNQDFTVVTNDI